MRSIQAQEFLRTAISTAAHYGFSPIEQIIGSEECRNCPKKIEHRAGALERRFDSLHGMLTTGMCVYFENKMNGITGPVLFYSAEQVPRTGDVALSLQVFNVGKSIAEALLIQTLRTLLEELGFTQYHVRVNSLGDSDSVSRYTRELSNYLRKRVADMPSGARELMKEHVFTALMYLIEKDHELAQKSPNPLEYLTDVSRRHFREIIEYLDMSNMPYEIDPKLIGHHQCYSEALFEFDIFDDDRQPLQENPLYVRGGRYNTFITRMSRTNIPAVGAVVVLKNKKAPESMPHYRAQKKPSIFMVQLGFGPKVRSLLLLNELRQAGITAYQNIASDSLSEQLREAEAREVRYAVIIGQKEYVEGTAIVRDLQEHCQEYIPLRSLTSRLKRTAGV